MCSNLRSLVQLPHIQIQTFMYSQWLLLNLILNTELTLAGSAHSVLMIDQIRNYGCFTEATRQKQHCRSSTPLLLQHNGYIQPCQMVSHNTQTNAQWSAMWFELLYLSPGDGWNLRVSRSSTRDDKLSAGLLTVFPTRPHIKVRGVLYSSCEIIIALGLKVL